ncbi:MAG: BMP family ABC transporter substrate-binding protein [Egibacteraceae bacterium]
MAHRKAALLLVLALLAAACGGGATTPTAPAEGGKVTKIGFLLVGPKDDFGYNQAAYEGSVAVAKAFPDIEVLRAENVPETADAERVMEDMIAQGATVIFPTSYGHLDPAFEEAKRHPEVIFVHQGGLEREPLDNLGTYFGTVWEQVYLGGIAAGAATKSNKLGFVAALPISQTLANINAFELGARSVNPKATTTVVFTSNWCDPAKQAEAAQSLLDQGADVITQHQDCTKTIIENAAAKGAKIVGYHQDASSLASQAWLTGAVWDWGPLYVDIVKTIVAGDFAKSRYNGDYRGGLRTGDNPFVLAQFGPTVSEDTKGKIEQARKDLAAGKSPFAGVRDQAGKVVYPTDKSPTYQEVDQMDFLVDGVIGTLPR